MNNAIKKDIKDLCSGARKASSKGGFGKVGFGKFASVNREPVELGEDNLKKEFALHGFMYDSTDPSGMMIFKLAN